MSTFQDLYSSCSSSFSFSSSRVVVVFVVVVVSHRPGDLWPRKYVKWQAVACYTSDTGGGRTLRVNPPEGILYAARDRYVSRALHQWLISRAVPRTWQAFKTGRKLLPREQGTRMRCTYIILSAVQG